MLEQRFQAVYTKFKLHFYQEVFSRFQNREASLTTVETFAMETILALGTPTINEFASFMRISSPNAAYKINSLIRKGYIEKVKSEQDRREYHLRPTVKYMHYYNISNDYVRAVMERIQKRFSPAECKKLEEMLTIIDRELMPEIHLPPAEKCDQAVWPDSAIPQQKAAVFPKTLLGNTAAFFLFSQIPVDPRRHSFYALGKWSTTCSEAAASDWTVTPASCSKY